MNKKYLARCNRFDKNGDYMPGSKIRLINTGIKTEDPAKEDKENRNQVVKEIEELVNRGVSIEEACNNLVEIHKSKFKYLPEDNLATIFAGWYNGRVKGKNRTIEGRTW